MTIARPASTLRAEGLPTNRRADFRLLCRTLLWLPQHTTRATHLLVSLKRERRGVPPFQRPALHPHQSFPFAGRPALMRRFGRRAHDSSPCHSIDPHGFRRDARRSRPRGVYRWVNGTSSDTPSSGCTDPLKPCTTVAAATTAAQPGDTIKILGNEGNGHPCGPRPPRDATAPASRAGARQERQRQHPLRRSRPSRPGNHLGTNPRLGAARVLVEQSPIARGLFPQASLPLRAIALETHRPHEQSTLEASIHRLGERTDPLASLVAAKRKATPRGCP